MVNSKDRDQNRDKGDGQETDSSSKATESLAAYNLDETAEKGFPLGKGKREQSFELLGHSQQASTSEEGEDMDHRYFEKYLDQRIVNIDQKITSIKDELQIRTDNIQRTLEQSLAQMQEMEKQRQLEMRERDNQRHAESQAVNARIDATVADIREDFRTIFGKIDDMRDGFDSKFDTMRDGFDSKFDTMRDGFDSKFDSMREEFDSKFDAMGAKFDSKFDAMGEKIDSTNKWIISFVIAALISLAAIVVSGLWAIFTK